MTLSNHKLSTTANEAYEITQYVPELLAIGSDGADDAIGFHRIATDPEAWPIVRIGFGNLDPADFVRLADGFSDWQRLEFRLKPYLQTRS